MTTQPEPMNFEEEARKILVKYRDAPTEPSGTVNIGNGLEPRTADVTWPIDEALNQLQSLALMTALAAKPKYPTGLIKDSTITYTHPAKSQPQLEGYSDGIDDYETNLTKAFGGAE